MSLSFGRLQRLLESLMKHRGALMTTDIAKQLRERAKRLHSKADAALHALARRAYLCAASIHEDLAFQFDRERMLGRTAVQARQD